MKSFVGVLGFLVFLLVMVLVLGSKFAEAQAEAAKTCTETRQALGLCK